MNPKDVSVGRALRGTSLQRMNAQYFYQLAAAILPLKTVEPGPIMESFSVLWTAERWILGYLHNGVSAPTTSAGAGFELYNAVKALTDNPSRAEPISYLEASNIKDVLLPKFENNLEAEYSSKDIFVVSKKGLYSITELIEGAEKMFSAEFLKRIGPAIPDLQQAGRCIAFQVPTAAAFHIFRAVEAVARLYVEKVRGTAPTDKEKRFGLGGFVGILSAHEADPRVTNAISQLAKLHRNPTMHPDISIKDDEVLATLGMAQSVIQSMVADMEKRDVNPMASIIEVLPTLEDLSYEEQAATDHADGVQPVQRSNGKASKGKSRSSKGSNDRGKARAGGEAQG